MTWQAIFSRPQWLALNITADEVAAIRADMDAGAAGATEAAAA
jgi:hypothetical protein